MTDLIENDYLLLRPGPLSTSPTVRAAMDRDWCTWDDDYTCVLIQGSGTFSVESMIGSVIPQDGKLLVLANGAYGNRLVHIAARLNINHVVHHCGELDRSDLNWLWKTLSADAEITHVVLVHNETTTGMMNPLEDIASVVKQHNKGLLVDSMIAFGGVPVDIVELEIDYIVSSANKCIQGVPGFGFIIGRISDLERTKGWARSLSLDLYDQWQGMENGKGKRQGKVALHEPDSYGSSVLSGAAGTGRRRRYLSSLRPLHGKPTSISDGYGTTGLPLCLAAGVLQPDHHGVLQSGTPRLQLSVVL